MLCDIKILKAAADADAWKSALKTTFEKAEFAEKCKKAGKDKVKWDELKSGGNDVSKALAFARKLLLKYNANLKSKIDTSYTLPDGGTEAIFKSHYNLVKQKGLEDKQVKISWAMYKSAVNMYGTILKNDAESFKKVIAELQNRSKSASIFAKYCDGAASAFMAAGKSPGALTSGLQAELFNMHMETFELAKAARGTKAIFDGMKSQAEAHKKTVDETWRNNGTWVKWAGQKMSPEEGALKANMTAKKPK